MTAVITMVWFLVIADSRATEQAGGTDEKHDGGHQVQHRQLDFGEERDAELADDSDHERADERALETPEAADDHDDEGEDERIDAHTEHGALLRHDNGAAEARHEAPEGERLDVHAIHVDSERRCHPHVLRRGAQHDPELRPIDEGPEADGGYGADDD